MSQHTSQFLLRQIGSQTITRGGTVVIVYIARTLTWGHPGRCLMQQHGVEGSGDQDEDEAGVPLAWPMSVEGERNGDECDRHPGWGFGYNGPDPRVQFQPQV